MIVQMHLIIKAVTMHPNEESAHNLSNQPTYSSKWHEKRERNMAVQETNSKANSI
ncbi:hypothetical protein KFK09_005723 [Dendrobium nobile]|uniref:Uncharacterized protein n=1 Tax=Dendrobium nobile TaxID=94219 RepID=A0A8T3BZY9_DENNO|nr:hypothetical protein KFK09_005723 [Dendrobium nobile]